VLPVIQYKKWQASCGKETRHGIIRGAEQSEWNHLAVRMTSKVNEGASGSKIVQKK
jgi:hypothetical protein